MRKRGGSKPGERRGGRKRGTPNKVTSEVRALAAEIVDDPIYRAKLLRDFRKRRVTPQVECLFWYFAYGRPIDRIAIGGPGDFDKKTEAELVAYILEAAQKLKP
jgi:hypothetical protein